MQTFNSPLKGHLLQVVPRPNDSALSRIATELKQEFGTVMQEPCPPSWAVLLQRLEASHRCEAAKPTRRSASRNAEVTADPSEPKL